MHDFTYHRPASIADALRLLEAGDSTKVLAGGMTLLPTMKLRLAAPVALVDLAGIDELRGVRAHGGAIEIAAMTTHADVAADASVRRQIPALAAMAAGIGDPQVRNRGTIGGSVSNNDPAADYPAALLALGATVVTSRREIQADEFFVDMFATALEPGELVTAVRFTPPAKAAYAKFRNPASRYAIVGVMVARTGTSVRVAVTGAASCVFRVPDMERALGDRFSASALAGIRLDAGQLASDIHADRDYRAHLVGVMAQRATEAALASA